MSSFWSSTIEILGVVFNLLFLLLLIKERASCWFFGIVASLLSIVLFVEVKLYSEAILYSYYVGMGIYGWVNWSKSTGEKLPIKRIRVFTHIAFIVLGVALSFGMGFYFQSNTDAEKPYADAFSTVFSFIATYLETQKVLFGWIYWIVINSFSIWLYSERGLLFYSYLMVGYAVLSVVGLVRWWKVYNADLSANKQV